MSILSFGYSKDFTIKDELIQKETLSFFHEDHEINNETYLGECELKLSLLPNPSTVPLIYLENQDEIQIMFIKDKIFVLGYTIKLSYLEKHFPNRYQTALVKKFLRKALEAFFYFANDMETSDRFLFWKSQIVQYKQKIKNCIESSNFQKNIFLFTSESFPFLPIKEEFRSFLKEKEIQLLNFIKGQIEPNYFFVRISVDKKYIFFSEYFYNFKFSFKKSNRIESDLNYDDDKGDVFSLCSKINSVQKLDNLYRIYSFLFNNSIITFETHDNKFSVLKYNYSYDNNIRCEIEFFIGNDCDFLFYGGEFKLFFEKNIYTDKKFIDHIKTLSHKKSSFVIGRNKLICMDEINFGNILTNPMKRNYLFEFVFKSSSETYEAKFYSVDKKEGFRIIYLERLRLYLWVYLDKVSECSGEKKVCEIIQKLYVV